MTYAEFLELAHPGDVLAVAGTDLSSRVIEDYTGPWSHVGFFVVLPYGDDLRPANCPFILESTLHRGVSLYPLSLYLAETDDPIHWFRLVNPLIFRSEILSFGFSQLGRPYAAPRQFVWSFGPITRLLRRLFGWGQADIDPDGVFCSELVAESLQEAGIVLTKQPAEMSPTDVCRLPDYEDMGRIELDVENLE
jgi:hypothetical protein